MKVLWLAPITLPAVNARLGHAGSPGGGWIESLRVALQAAPGLELGVGCVTSTPFDAFVEDGVTYLPIHHEFAASRLGRAVLAATWRDRSIDYVPRCIDVVRQFAPDVIEVHGTETTLAGIVERTHVPTVLSLQGIVSEVVAHYFDGVSRGEVARDTLRLGRTLRGLSLYPRYRALRRCVAGERRAIAAAKFFTGRTRFDLDAVRRLNRDGQYFHGDHILAEEFCNAAESTRDPDVIYCAGGRAPYKGIEVAIAATAELVRRGHDNVRLRVGGPVIGTEMGPILQRRAAREGIADRVNWLGRLSAAQIAEELSSCGVCLVPSHIDNSPNVLAEAMMVGAPCVASACGGIPSMVDERETALLFEPGDAAAAADEIGHLLSDPALAAKLGRAARQVAIARHDPKRIAVETLAMYAEMLSGHRGDPCEPNVAKS
jgi:glycosyltransferase involved in cell wall biosynthesis